MERFLMHEHQLTGFLPEGILRYQLFLVALILDTSLEVKKMCRRSGMLQDALGTSPHILCLFQERLASRSLYFPRLHFSSCLRLGLTELFLTSSFSCAIGCTFWSPGNDRKFIKRVAGAGLFQAGVVPSLNCRCSGDVTVTWWSFTAPGTVFNVYSRGIFLTSLVSKSSKT